MQKMILVIMALGLSISCSNSTTPPATGCAKSSDCTASGGNTCTVTNGNGVCTCGASGALCSGSKVCQQDACITPTGCTKNSECAATGGDTCTVTNYNGVCTCGATGALCATAALPVCQNAICLKQFTKTANRHVFLTSGDMLPGTAYQAGKLTFNTVAGADQLCQDAAVAAKWPGTWAAVIADSTNFAVAHLTPLIASDTKPIYLLDDTTQVATSLESVAKSGTLLAPISTTETLTVLTAAKWVWTGAANLTTHAISANDCSDWTINTGGNFYFGVSNAAAGQASWFGSNTATGCDNLGTGLYCLEVSP